MARARSAREARRLAKPEQLGDRLHLSLDEHTGRVTVGVFLDREHVDGRNRVAGDACALEGLAIGTGHER
jgi:hypothetical protein